MALLPQIYNRTNKDFDSLRVRLISLLQTVFPDWSDDAMESGPKRGMGKALLAAAEEDARALGTKGMAAWGVWLPSWMKAS